MGGFISLHLVDVVEAAEPARDREAEAMQQLRLGFVVLFVTTRSSDRLTHILQAAARIMRNARRTLFLGVTLSTFLSHDAPLTVPIFQSPTDRKQSLVPKCKKTTC